MAGRLVAQGALTIMDFSDAIISSTPPSNPFENMIWIDTSQNPPVHKIYKYFYDDDGNKIGEGWVEIGETLPIPPGIAFGGYLTCKITFKAGSTGGIEISSGYFSNNKVPKTVITTNCRIVTQLNSNKGRIRFIIFTNKDTSLTYKQGFGTNDSFLIAIRQNGKWYYEGQGSTLVEFTPKSDYCNVGKIVEYSSSEKGTGIKEIIMYAEDPESMFNLLTGEGERQGMFKTEDGKVFINGEYINAKNLKVIDTNNNTTFYVNEQGEVTIRATEFSLEGKTIGDMLNEMEIGGRNFHLGSEKWSNSAFTAKTGSIIEENVLTVQSKQAVNSCYMNVEAGEEYTFSVDMKTTTNTYNSHTYLIQYYNSANTRLSYEWNTSQLTTSWKRFSQTFTIPDNVTKVSIGYRSDSTTLVSYRYPKFEKGNKATDWTPAPEDLRNEMNDAINLQKQRIDDIVNDSNLTASEKRQLQIMIEDIKQEYENIVSSCTKYGVDYTDLDVYYNDLNSYLEQDCAIYDLSITTGVDKDTLKGYFASYYQARENTYELLDAARKTLLDGKLSSSDSEAVFKALTNNGKKQGLYMKDGNFYFNGQYINAKNLKVVDNDNNTTLYINQDGKVTIRATEFSLEGKTIDNYISEVNDTINNVSKNVTTQKERIDSILDDGNLSVAEKRQLQIILSEITQNNPTVVTSAQTYGIDCTLLNSYLEQLTTYLENECAMNDLTTSTAVDKSVLKNYFDTYYQERESILSEVRQLTEDKIDDKIGSTESTKVFNALTNQGKRQGIYMQNGQLYINGQYVNTKNLKAVDKDGNVTFFVDENGNVTIRAKEFSLEGKTIDNYISEVNDTISSVSGNINTQKERIDSILDDGTLSVAEKRQLQIILSDLLQTHSTVDTNADTYGINHDQLDTLLLQLQNYLEQTCLINDLTVTTGIDKDTLKTYFNNYYMEREYIITEVDIAMEAKIDDKIGSTESTKVFNALTNQGKRQGIYLQNEQLYINGQYVNTKNLKAVDKNNNTTFFVDENGNVTIRAKEFSLEGKSIDDYINGIEVGSKNLLRKSSTFALDSSGKAGWVNTGNKWTVAYSEDDQCYVVSASSTGLTAIGIKSFFSNTISCKQGDTFTLSCWVKVKDVTAFDYGVTFIIDEYDSSGARIAWQDTDPAVTAGTNKVTFESNKWTYCTATYTIRKDTATKLGIRLCIFKNGEISFKLPKLEKGNKATDWTPAPEDLEDEMNTLINAQKARIDEMLADGTLSVAEKRQLQRVLKNIEQEYTQISTTAQTYGIDINNFYAMYNTLRNYLIIDCTINDLTVSTGIIKNTVQTCFENYYTERANISSQIDAKVDDKIGEKLSASDSAAVFNALTNQGKRQGLYLQNGNFYFNGQYINAKNLSVQNAKGETTLNIDSDGNVSILATAFKLGGKTIADIVADNTVVTMKRVSIQYYISTSPTALSGGSWSTTKPTWVSGKYIWQKTVTTYSDNTTAESDPVCITGPQGAPGNKGDQGVSITKVSNRYGITSSKTTPPTTWYTSYPAWTKGRYIWTKSIISYSNGTTTETDPYVDTSWETMANVVDGKVDNSQEAVFNALTNNGNLEGLYMSNGKLYINGTYIKADTITGDMLKADSIDGKTITGATLEGCRIFAAKDDTQTDGHKFRIYTDGRIYSNNFIQCYGATPNDNKYSQLDDGFIIATEYVQSPAIKTTKQNLYFGINDVAVPGTGDNTNRLRFCQIGDNKFFMPDYNATSSTTGVRLGASGHMWSTVYAKGGVNTGSDRTVKENIRYLNAENELATQSEDINEKDLYNFVRDDLMVAEYNFKGEERTEIGFIAQDILYNLDGSDNKVGQILVNKPDEEQSPLTYSEKTYSNILAGALRQAINKIEALEKRVEELEKK